MTTIKYRILNPLVLICFTLSLTAQAQTLSLEDIYQNNTYPTRGYQSVLWMGDHEHYTTLEHNPGAGCKEIIRYNVKSGERVVLVGAADLIPPGSSGPLQLSDYTWSGDQQHILLFANTKKVWRYHTRGDYWLLNVKSGHLKQLGKDLEPSSLMFAKFSPDESRVAFVSKNNIYVEEVEGDLMVQITHDGSQRFVNGTFDWVYEEEFKCMDGFRWSNDSENIVYWQSDTEGTGIFYMINNLDSIYSIPLPFPYPKVGTTNSAVKIGVVSSGGGQSRWFDIPGDPRNNYLVRMETIPGSEQVMIQQLNRLQNTNRVWLANIKSMEVENILIESDEAFLDLHDTPIWLDKDENFTWMSERNGWRHLYKVSRDGSEIQQLTRGEFDVIQVVCIDPGSGFVYYIASPDNYTQRYLYRSKLNGKGPAQRLSPEEQGGQHSYVMSGDARYALHTYQSAATPPVISLLDVKKHEQVRVMEDNLELVEKVEKLGLNHKEFIKVDIGDVTLDAWMIRPPGFDPERKYPVIFYVYGEPASSTVQDSWSGGDLWHQYLAQQGYVVISVDNRGTKTPRGRAWRKSIYGQIGILASLDQAAAARKLLSTYSFLDPDRVGIWGWSGGGSMTLNCMFRFPELYKTGIAIAFVSHQKLYDTAYQERYMGLPSGNPEGFRNGSPITHAAGLEGNLLLIHGTADDNVHYQSFEILVDELIKQNKLFDMMAYPMRSHSIRERENTSLHLRRTMARYWNENL